MNEKSIKDILNKSIEIMIDDPLVEINEKSKLISDNIIDSLGVIELVNIIESKFKIVIEQDELDIKYLDSIDGMTNFILNKIK